MIIDDNPKPADDVATVIRKLRKSDLLARAAELLQEMFAENCKLLDALRQCKTGAEYPDELGDIIDAAIAAVEGRQ